MLPAENIVSQLEQLTPDAFNKVFQLMATRQVQSLTSDIQNVKDALMKQDEKIDQLEILHTDLAKKQYHIESKVGSIEYLNASLLAKQNNPTFSAQRMNKLLRFAGVLNSYGTPYAEYLNRTKSPLIQEKKSNDGVYMTYHYHRDRIWKIIENALKEGGVYHKFLACKTKPEIDELIDSLEI